MHFVLVILYLIACFQVTEQLWLFGVFLMLSLLTNFESLDESQVS